jgi:hypothetical protein
MTTDAPLRVARRLTPRQAALAALALKHRGGLFDRTLAARVVAALTAAGQDQAETVRLDLTPRESFWLNAIIAHPANHTR